MTAAEYEAAIVVRLVRERNRSETPIGKWRVQRVDRNWPAPSVSFIATQGVARGGVRVKGPDVVTVADLMARWDAGAPA